MHVYRTPGIVEVDLPHVCVPERAAPPWPWHGLSPGFAKALAAATTLFLLVSSAAVGAFTYTVVAPPPRGAVQESVQVSEPVQSAAPFPLACDARPAPHARRERAPSTPPPPPPSHASPPHPRAELSALATIGPETHDVEQLWSRARALRAYAPGLKMMRSEMRPDPVPESFQHLRVAPWVAATRAPGLRVGALDARSAVARAGLRSGDVVSGINGYAMDQPGALANAWGEASAARATVLEIDRPGSGPIILRIDLRP